MSSYRSKDFDASVDRSKGVDAGLSGAWFQVVGDVPVTLRVSAGENGSAFPVVPYQVYPLTFAKLVVVHASGLEARPFTIITGGLSDTVPASPSVGFYRGTDFYEIARMPTTLARVGASSDQTVLALPNTKRIRLFSIDLHLTGDAAAAAAAVKTFAVHNGSGTAYFGYWNVWVPAAAPASPSQVGASFHRDFGPNGYLFTAGWALYAQIAALTGGLAVFNFAYSVENVA